MWPLSQNRPKCVVINAYLMQKNEYNQVFLHNYQSIGLVDFWLLYETIHSSNHCVLYVFGK